MSLFAAFDAVLPSHRVPEYLSRFLAIRLLNLAGLALSAPNRDRSGIGIHSYTVGLAGSKRKGEIDELMIVDRTLQWLRRFCAFSKSVSDEDQVQNVYRPVPVHVRRFFGRGSEVNVAIEIEDGVLGVD